MFTTKIKTDQILSASILSSRHRIAHLSLAEDEDTLYLLRNEYPVRVFRSTVVRRPEIVKEADIQLEYGFIKLMVRPGIVIQEVRPQATC